MKQKAKNPEQYIVKNIDLNMQEKTVSKPVQHAQTYGTVNSMMRGQTIDKQVMECNPVVTVAT